MIEKERKTPVIIENEIQGYREESIITEDAEKEILTEIGLLSADYERKKKHLSVLATASALIVLLTAGALMFLFRSSSTEEDSEDRETLSSLAEKSGEETEEEPEETEESTEATSEAIYADIDVEGYGTITVLLNEEEAPITVENFVSLAESGFYDGLTFHRIIEGFMIQGGDPNGNGTGGSDTTIKGEFSDNGVDNTLSHTRGAISMARSSDYDSASSQFFIVQEDCTSLDGQYAVFGYVTEGMDIVDSIAADAEPTDDNGTIPADEQPVITSITIRREAENDNG